MHNGTYAAEYVSSPPDRSIRRDRKEKKKLDSNSSQDLTRSIVKEARRHISAREAVGSQGHECKGEGDNRVVSGVKGDEDMDVERCWTLVLERYRSEL